MKDDEMARYFQKAAPRAALVLSDQPHEEDAHSMHIVYGHTVQVTN